VIKKSNDILKTIITGIILGLMLFILQKSCHNQEVINIVKNNTKIDTQFIQGKTPDPIYIQKKVYIKRVDTVFLDKKEIITNPFSITIDTVTLEKDTVSISYLYPEQEFSLMIKKPAPVIKTITITNTNYVEYSNWNKALYFIGGLTTMYLIQTQINK
jgi:hypothetical protein